MAFLVVMYGCENWTIKKVEHQRTDALKLWCWSRLLRVLLDSKEIQPVNSKGSQPWLFPERTDAEASVCWPPDVKNWLIGKDTDHEKDWRQKRRGQREWDGWMASSIQWPWVWANSGRYWRTGKPGVLHSKGSQRVGLDWATEQQMARLPPAP